MAEKTCDFETCKNTTHRGEKFCSLHNHILALQQEMARIRTLIPVDLRMLKASIGPELENLLSALARLVVCADPLRASAFGGGSPTARLPDRWTGQSQLDERGDNIVTHRGAASTAYSRQTLIPRYKDKLQTMADDIIDALNPNENPRPRVEKPRCGVRECKRYDRRQDVDSLFCGKCGTPFSIDSEPNSSESPRIRV